MANIQIPITENGTVTLATAGKYCDRNIDVNVNIPDRYEEGKQAEYDAFWDTFQDYGNRVDYTQAFLRAGWTDATFRPKYNMTPTAAGYMFTRNTITDLVGILNDCNVTLDTSHATSMIAFAQLSMQLTRLPTISLVSAGNNLTNLFFECYGLREIEKVIFKDDGSQSVSDPQTMFGYCIKLESITVEGKIGFSISFKWSPLDKESITSIVNALLPTATGKTLTLKKTAKEAAFTADEWATLIATKPNWTISLV